MNIAVPRYVVVALGAVFSTYLLMLAVSVTNLGNNRSLHIAAMVLYAVATIVSLSGTEKRMPRWNVFGNVAVSIALPIMVTSQLDPGHPIGTDYTTWYVAAVGTLMVITSARGHTGFAWAGIVAVVVHTILWAGPVAVVPIGALGSTLWVAVSHALQHALRKAERDARVYALAERETAAWQAAQEAHLFERQFRIGQTERMAIPMLRHIVAVKAELTPEQRRECQYLEAGIRDEIRGRSLLDDAVREQVMAARRRGTTVTLLDEGGIDSLPADEVARVHAEIARAVWGSKAETIVVRTVPGGSETAVTVVGLESSGVNLLGHSGGDHDEPEVELWLEIPRFRQMAEFRRASEG